MTSTTTPMLEAYPGPVGIDRARLAATIDALLACSQACTACADACLAEDDVMRLAGCVRTNLDCADICATAARVLSRHTGYDAELAGSLLETCVTACRACADRCSEHAHRMEHCRICADACRACGQSCRDLLGALG